MLCLASFLLYFRVRCFFLCLTVFWRAQVEAVGVAHFKDNFDQLPKIAERIQAAEKEMDALIEEGFTARDRLAAAEIKVTLCCIWLVLDFLFVRLVFFWLFCFVAQSERFCFRTCVCLAGRDC